MQYQIKYYDGLKSQSHSAILFIKKNIWLIEYKDFHGNEIHVFWHPSLIKPVEISGNTVTLSYGDFPPASIECNDETITDQLEPAKGWKSASTILFRFNKTKGRKAVVSLTAALLLLVVFIYFVILPFAAEFFTVLIPASYERKLGYYMTDQFLLGETVDDELSIALNEFSAHINYDMDYEPSIIAIEGDKINAFALPGGYIVVFEGILKNIKNEQQLAALLCHEAAHIKYRHSLKSILRNIGGFIFISLLFSDLNAVTAIIVENAHTLHTLSYSRSIEQEADEKALEMLSNNNISQQGMVELFRILKKEETVSRSELNFLNTHPLTDKRINYSSSIADNQNNFTENPVLLDKWNKIKDLISQ